MNYHPDARRYETGSLAYSLFHGWTAGLELVKEVGIQFIHDRVIELTDRIIAGLKDGKITLVSPVEKISERSAILSFTLGTEEANIALHKRLLAENVIVAVRDGRIRVSPNFYNTPEEIDRFLALL